MKKLFTLLMLTCMVCTGAWAEDYQSAQLKDGMLIRFRSYHCNYYMSIGNQSNNSEKTQLRGYSASQTDGRDVFQLQGSPEAGFKLYNSSTGKYIGKANGGSNTTVTDDASQAGVYKFSDATSTDNPARTGFSIGTKCVVLTCTEGTTANSARCMHQSNTDGSVVTWSATQGSYFVISSACEMPKEGEYYCIRPYYNSSTLGYLYDNGTKLQANGTSESESAIFRAEKVNNNKVAFRFVNTEKYLRWTQGFDGTGKSNPNTGYNTSYNEEYNTMTIYPADNRGNKVNAMRDDYQSFLGLAAINGKGTNGSTYYFLPRMSDGGFVAANANELYFDNSATGRTPYFKIEKVDMSSYVSTLQTKINAAYEGNGKLGYPDMTSIESYSGSALTATDYETATTALKNLYNSTDIKLPEDGKAYYFVNYQMASADDKALAGNKWMMKYVENDHSLGTVAYTSQVPEAENIFICRKVENNRFVFVTTDGRYLRYYGSGDSRNGALSEAYSQNDGSVTIKKQAHDSNVNIPLESCFGFVTLNGYRKSNMQEAPIIVRGDNGWYNATSSVIIRYSNTNDSNPYSTAFRIFEAPDGNPNTIKLTNPNKEAEKKTLLDQRYVGTFSAPYAVELRGGVEAYIASVSDNVVTFSKLEEGHIVPKNTGVMLYAPEAQDNITTPAIPAIDTVDMNDHSNAFVGSNAGSVEMQSGYYVLGKKEAGVGFYPAVVESTLARNKAYLDLSQHQQVSAFKFDFEDEGVTTAISSALGLDQKNEGVAYDLAGRRCNIGAKGISIVGGKKVIR